MTEIFVLKTYPPPIPVGVASHIPAPPGSPCVPAANPIPTIHDGTVVRGEATGRVRAVPFEMDLPEYPKTASFFGQQEGQTG